MCAVVFLGEASQMGTQSSAISRSILAAEFVLDIVEQIIAVDNHVGLAHRKHGCGRSDGISRKNRWPYNETSFGHLAGGCF